MNPKLKQYRAFIIFLMRVRVDSGRNLPDLFSLIRNSLINKLNVYKNNKKMFVKYLNMWRILMTQQRRLGIRVHSSTIAHDIQEITGFTWSISLKIACSGGY
jgi:hypothetical protein